MLPSRMQLRVTSKALLTFRILIALVVGWAMSAPLLSSVASPARGEDEGAAAPELLFDPGHLEWRIGLTDDYGEKPFIPHPKADSESPYRPNLEDEYY